MEVDFERLKKYVSSALRRISALGGEIVAFGSGGARKSPEGFDKKKATQQIKDFLNMASEIAGRTNITLAVEPLNKNETNMINTLKEAKELCESINKDNIRLLFDTFHFDMEKESWEDLSSCMDKVVHVHVADTGRYFPGSGNFDFKPLFDILKKCGYNKRISCECGFKDFKKESESTIKYLKRYM
jgi:sugar phosphate isomerase/epimerase